MLIFKAATFALASLIGASASAQQNAYFEGKTVRIISPSEPGAYYDVGARLLAQHLGNHLRGKPKIIVQAMAGTGGLRVANYIFNVAPRDGTVIGAVFSSIPSAPLLTPQGVQFDATKLNWLGSLTEDPFIGYVWNTAPVRALAEAKERQIVVGGQSPGGASIDLAIIAKAFFGFKLKIVRGYSGPAAKLAMERGEIDGTFANGWTDLKTSKPNWIRDGQVTILTQFGFERHQELPGVPLFVDEAKTDADRAALELLLARQKFSAPFIAPPGLQAERLAELRHAFAQTLEDADFLQEAQRANFNIYKPMQAAELQRWVERLSSTPMPVVERVARIFAEYSDDK